jgi:hypothetical protein
VGGYSLVNACVSICVHLGAVSSHFYVSSKSCASSRAAAPEAPCSSWSRAYVGVGVDSPRQRLVGRSGARVQRAACGPLTLTCLFSSRRAIVVLTISVARMLEWDERERAFRISRMRPRNRAMRLLSGSGGVGGLAGAGR